MKRTLQFSLLFFSVYFFSQNLEEKISDQICNCIGNLENLQNPELKIQECFQESLEDHYIEITKKLSDPQNQKTKNYEDYYISIEGLLLTNCKNFLEYRKKGLIREEQESLSECNDVKTGTFYYEILQGREKSYLTFTKNEVIETRKDNVYSIYKIEWIDNCTYKLSLISTNSNYDETYLKNKSLVFRIIENNPDYFVVQTEYFENGGLNNVKIFKLPFTNESK